jgi:uncharacterized protein
MTTSVAGLRRNPRQPSVHLDQVVLKVVQHCNLNCTYCYVYNRGDDSWRSRPLLILDTVVQQLARRIDEHCARHNVGDFTVELHGGEPLLLGARRMQRVIDSLRSGIRSTRLRFTLQTNGLLLTREWIDLFQRNHMLFGVSLDGPPELADRKRIVLKDGGGSTQKLLDVIARLRVEAPAFDEVFSGCLCVVNPDYDGGMLVDWFVDQGFTGFDFLLPDGSRANLPQDWQGIEPYTRFLLSAFERWYSMGSRAPQIRKFELMMMGLMGVDVPLDALGGDLRRLCVVESDGSIGVSDVARICGGEFSRDVLNIFDDALDEHVSRYRIDDIQRVCAECEVCPHLASCGGGYLPHRFDGTGFDNPSLYCDALFALSARMVRALREGLPAHVWVDAAPVQAIASS